MGEHSITQTGDTLIATDLLQYGGYYVGGYDGYGQRFPIYTFAGGTLAASNIELDAQWVIGSGQNGAVTNPGYFEMAGTLVISNANEQLGTFVLGSNTVTNYTGAAIVTTTNLRCAKIWRRRELNPRPCLVSQPRLHA